MRVVDAEGAPPTVPFLAPARRRRAPPRLSAAVSRAPRGGGRAAGNGDIASVAAWLAAEAGRRRRRRDRRSCGISLAARAALGVLPTQRRVVFERFFDEAGGMQLVVHARVRGPDQPRARARAAQALLPAVRLRAPGRGQRRRRRALARSGQKLPARGRAAVPDPRTREEVLAQALLLSPMFQVRVALEPRPRARWCSASAAGAGRRRRSSGWRPTTSWPPCSRRWPAARRTRRGADRDPGSPDRAPDDARLPPRGDRCGRARAALRRLPEREPWPPVFRETTESLAAGARDPQRPAVHLPRRRPARGAADARRRAPARPARDGARPRAARPRGDRAGPRGSAARLPRRRGASRSPALELVVLRPEAAYTAWFQELAEKRAGRAGCSRETGQLWLAAEQRAARERPVSRRARIEPDVRVPAGVAAPPTDEERRAMATTVRGHLARLGPCTAAELADGPGLAETAIPAPLGRLEADGLLLRGHFDPAHEPGAEEFCERRLLARIHRVARPSGSGARSSPSPPQDLLRFLLRWQHVAAGSQLEGRQGSCRDRAAAGIRDRRRVLGGGPCCRRASGAIGPNGSTSCACRASSPGRVSRSAALPPGSPGEAPRPRGLTPSHATPVSFLVRGESAVAPERRAGRRAEPDPAGTWAHARRAPVPPHPRGALLPRSRLAHGGSSVEVTEALWDLVARGCSSRRTGSAASARSSARGSGGSHARRARLARSARRSGQGARRRRPLGPRAGARSGERRRRGDGLAEAVAEQLLARWGVVFRDLVARETLAVSWREILWAFRRLEARGTIRGGRFVTGFVGEQYALPEAPSRPCARSDGSSAPARSSGFRGRSAQLRSASRRAGAPPSRDPSPHGRLSRRRARDGWP